jgi:hypothetical protein
VARPGLGADPFVHRPPPPRERVTLSAQLAPGIGDKVLAAPELSVHGLGDSGARVAAGQPVRATVWRGLRPIIRAHGRTALEHGLQDADGPPKRQKDLVRAA